MRYIDADALYEKLYPLDLVDKKLYTINAKEVADAIANTPTADVVPKSEVEKIQEAYNNRLAKDIQTNAYFVKYAKADVAREIFEEIEEYVIKGISVGGEHLTLFNGKNFAELKKKYTEEQE